MHRFLSTNTRDLPPRVLNASDVLIHENSAAQVPDLGGKLFGKCTHTPDWVSKEQRGLVTRQHLPHEVSESTRSLFLIDDGAIHAELPPLGINLRAGNTQKLLGIVLPEYAVDRFAVA